MRRLAEDCSIVIEQAGKGFCVVVWDRKDHPIEAKKDLSDSNTFKEVTFDDNELLKLAEVSNTMLKKAFL